MFVHEPVVVDDRKVNGKRVVSFARKINTRKSRVSDKPGFAWDVDIKSHKLKVNPCRCGFKPTAPYVFDDGAGKLKYIVQCTHCGKGKLKASDSPHKAIISWNMSAQSDFPSWVDLEFFDFDKVDNPADGHAKAKGLISLFENEIKKTLKTLEEVERRKEVHVAKRMRARIAHLRLCLLYAKYACAVCKYWVQEDEKQQRCNESRKASTPAATAGSDG